MKRNYHVELKSGFTETITADNLKQAKALADRMARGNDTVLSVSLIRHGGSRPGSGRPKKEPTKTLSYRVPASLSNEIDTAIRKIISTISKS